MCIVYYPFSVFPALTSFLLHVNSDMNSELVRWAYFCTSVLMDFSWKNGGAGTPLWRNGPPDKPVLCNACGSRWRTKGSLANYTPMHRKDDIDDDEPRVSKLKPPTSKLKSQKKKPNHIIMENGPFSGQNFRKMGDVDQSYRSSSGSAVSYSGSCAPYGAADASEMTGQ